MSFAPCLEVMSTANILATSYVSTASPRWIIGKREDLTWFVGSTLTGYIALAILSGLQHQATSTALAVIWAFVISGPHFFATATRTYLDKEQRQKTPRLLWFIVPVIIAPMAIIAAGGTKLLFVFGAAWGTFHITKQHLGIMMLYKRVNRERSKTDFMIDKWFLLASQILPLALLLLWYLSIIVRGPLFVGAGIIQLVLVIGYSYRQTAKYRAGEEMNWPKLMLLALVIPLHWLALVCATTDPIKGIFIFTIAVNFGHSLQYHRLTWFHNRNRYREKQGLSGFLSRRALYFYGASLVMYLIFFAIGQTVRGNELLLTGPIFMHYILDARIWRVREDPELAQALRLT
jgi:hypothetical protein